LAEQLRNAIPGVVVSLHMGGGSLKSQIKKADKSGATYAIILGEEEVARQTVGLKSLRRQEDQLQIEFTKLPEFLTQALKMA